MLVQALAAYADEYLSGQLAEEAWEEKPVPFLIELGAGGTFLDAVPRQRQEVRGAKIITLSETLQVPKSPVNRNSGLHPLIAADDIKYVLGAGAWTAPKDEQNATERHEAFVQLIKRAAEETENPALQNCVLFFERPDQVERAKESLKSAKPGTFVALSCDGPVIQLPEVRQFWNSHFRAAFQTRVDSGGIGECLVSGKIGPIAPTHEKIKGLASVGGQASGVSLMSFDKSAFRSYGWEQNANSPVSPDRANAYVLAFNDLLRSNDKRKDVAGVAFIYWTRKKSDFNVMNILDPAQVKALLSLDHKADPDPNMFYMAGLVGNGARLQIRYWLAESLGRIKANIKEWFDGTSIVNSSGERDSSAQFWQFPPSLSRDGEPPAGITLSLVRRALEGSDKPLGPQVLSALVLRLRRAAESKADSKDKKQTQDLRFTSARLGLLRLCLNDMDRKGVFMNASLDQKQANSAYLCGRLLAEFENLQKTSYRAAQESAVNVTVADRHFTLASTNPQIAFPKLERASRAHFRKLEAFWPKVKDVIEREVRELHEQIGTSFPPMLSLDDQGRFALGYYHQKAEHSRKRIENSEAKANKSHGELEADSQEPTI